MNICRYRGSTDDLRRSREDINIPSFIPKLLSPKNKEEKLKRQDSKDDIRQIPGLNRRQKEPLKEETKPPPYQTSFRDDVRTGIKFFRRESREDVGRENATSISNSCVTKERLLGKEEPQEWIEEYVGETTRSKSMLGESNSTIASKESIESKFVAEDQKEDENEVSIKMANELTQSEDHFDEPNVLKSSDKDQESFFERDKDEVNDEGRKIGSRRELEAEKKREEDKSEDTPDFKNIRETAGEAICGSENNYADVIPFYMGEKKFSTDAASFGKKTEDFQVVS